ncbi:MAG TPA: zinc-dependent metalloprotease, partial [Candidatus Kapabacteria bacterium]|nr:zinc-dependent metalloprotease [Candidatus Kapabacteria bacterium]
MKPFSVVKFLFILLFATAAFAAAPQKADTSKPAFKSIKEETKSCRKFDGLFPIYQDTTTGSAYIQIAANQIGKEFIYFSFTVDGVADAGQIRGGFRSDRVFSIHKYFDRIEFQLDNTSYYFDSTNALHRAANANINEPLLASEKITAEDSGHSAYLIPADGLFLAENFEQVKPSPFPGLPPNKVFSLGMLDKEKTQYVSIENFPANTDVTVEYVYDNPAPMNGGGTDVTDARFVSIKIQHTLIQVPDDGFQPRPDDPRVGFFTTERDDMTSTSATPYSDVIHRWNLVKKYPDSALSEPVKPITYWIENTTPVEFRETIKKAGLAWNEAFEQAGFKNAVVIKEQPDTATWKAGDIRYNVIRWTSSPQPYYGGYGPSFVNPLTGEILGADIMLEYVFMTNRVHYAKLWQSTMAADGNPLPEDEDPMAIRQDNIPPSQFCDLTNELHNSTLFGLEAMDALGYSDVDKKKLIKESLYYLVLHEMGHTLGLMHNMKGSQLWSPAQINDTTLTEKIGLTGSVMDYPAINISLDRSKQGQYMTTKPGPYDKWAIEYGYSPALADATAEHERLEKILSRSTDPQLVFGNDADDMRQPGFGIDPRAMIGDMSNDAITYSIGRMQLADTVMKTIKEKYDTPGQSYQELRNAY